MSVDSQKLHGNNPRQGETIICIHQPNYIPWLGYFHKISYSDAFVFQDSVQYTPKIYINRAYVRNNNAQIRMTIPVSLKRWDVPISDVMIDTNKFERKHLATLRHCYGKCKYYDEVIDFLSPAFRMGETNLADFNIKIIRSIAEYLGFAPTFVRQSDLDVSQKNNQLLIEISLKCEGDIFVSGTGAKTYIAGHEMEYQKAGITLAYQNFIHPIYHQSDKPFLEGCSIVDLLFRMGQDSAKIISSQDEQPYIIWREQT